MSSVKVIIQKLTKNVVFKNFSYVTIGNVIAQALNLLAIIKITKLFSPEDYGQYTFLAVQGQLLFTLSELGLRNIIVRSIARDKSITNNLVCSTILLRLTASLIIAIVFYGYSSFSSILDRSTILIVCLFPFVNLFTNLFESIFWAYQKMLLPALINVLTSLLWVIFIFVTPPQILTVSGLFSIYILLNALTGVMFLFILKAKGFFVGQLDINFKSVNLLLRQGWPYLSLILLNIPFTYLTNNFLEFNSTKTEIGYFNLAQKILSPVSLVMTMALTALFPNLSNLWVTDQDRFKRILSSGIKFFIVGASVLCFLFTVFLDNIVTTIVSNAYLPVIKVSQLQIWFVFLMGVNSLIGTIWGATNRENMLFKSSGINFLISTPLLFWGSKYGALGLAYAYVISFAIFEIYLWITFTRSIKIRVIQNNQIWLIAVVLFSLSFFVIAELSLYIKLIISFAIIIALSFYFLGDRNKITTE